MNKMKSKQKRLIIIILALLIVVISATLFLHVINNNENDSEEKIKELNNHYYVTQNTKKYTFFMPINNKKLTYEDNMVWDELQELTNIQIEFISPINGNGAEEALNLIIAGGNYPDVVLNTTAGYPGGYDRAIRDEVYIDIREYKDLMPNYMGIINKYEILKNEVYTEAGNLPGFWRIFDPDNSLSIIGGLTIREDMLKETGLGIPKTIKDWTILLRELKKIEGVEYPLIFGQENGVNVTAEFLSAYGIGAAPISIMNPLSQLFYPEDGIIKYAAVEDGYIKYLLLMNQWYEEGLLDNNFGINKFIDVDDRKKLISQGKACVNWQYAEWFTSVTDTEGNEISMVAAPVPKINEDDENPMWPVSRKPNISEVISITTQASEPEILIKFFDFLYSEKGIEMTNYGIEDDTFMSKKGNKIYTDKILNYPEGPLSAVAKYINNYTGVRFDLSYTYDVQTQLYGDKIVQMKETWENSSNRILVDYNLTVEENTNLIQIMNGISAYVNEYTVKAIVDKSVAFNWERQVNQINSMGLKRAMIIVQDAYDRREKQFDLN